MLRLAFKKAAATAAAISAVRPSRPYATDGRDVARQMIRYALGHARSQKSAESYSQAAMILEQGLVSAREREPDGDGTGLFLLAMSTLLYERGELQDAVEKLQLVRHSGRASLGLKVAAYEALIGLDLEAGKDDASSALADEFGQLLGNAPEDSAPTLEVLKLRAKAVKGLVHILHGDVKSVELSLGGCQNCNMEGGEDQIVTAALSYGEYSHCTGNFSLAKDLYEKVLHALQTKDIADSSYLASTNMVSEEILLGATCALGQLLSHSGKFTEAEELLTTALTRAENHFGSTHPKVGVVLTCIAIMFRHKAKMEASSSILIQEGLYRRALDLLKAPALDSEVADKQAARRDMVALARGGYAEILCIQQNRKGEGERMREWAMAAWKNPRLSLAQVLEFSEPSEAAVVDTRICRVL